MKLTEWFPGHIKPVRRGVYQHKDATGTYVGYRYWDGERWSLFCLRIDSALSLKRHIASDCYQDHPWRGVAK